MSLRLHHQDHTDLPPAALDDAGAMRDSRLAATSYRICRARRTFVRASSSARLRNAGGTAPAGGG